MEVVNLNPRNRKRQAAVTANDVMKNAAAQWNLTVITHYTVYPSFQFRKLQPQIDESMVTQMLTVRQI